MSEVSVNPDDLPVTWVLTSLGAVVDYGSTTKVDKVLIADQPGYCTTEVVPIKAGLAEQAEIVRRVEARFATHTQCRATKTNGYGVDTCRAHFF